MFIINSYLLFIMKVQEVETKSNAWKDVIAVLCQELLPAGKDVDDVALGEQLLMLFDDGMSDVTDEQMFRALKSEHSLYVSISGNERKRVETVLHNTLCLCDEVFEHIPDTMAETVDYKRFITSRVKQFKARGERAVFRISRNMNVAIVEVMVETKDLACQEFLYWNKDKVYVMSFVPELDAKLKKASKATFMFV